ncbi:Hydroxymethylpyrimidine transport system permease protein [Bifidobacterium subtile]|uniref:Hydroxymethylpyrimidine transport system permease protein n=1 Tax=Bifidobacterium subtile TaxID=77635 RepID=A0A087E8R9_9BIFI|nr:ECF transporter S component [Bifidobacterium subtile]KFJ04170.1 Hydroxymethylpyrimidine transport system permease protein [Bifidobacterium subtile]
MSISSKSKRPSSSSSSSSSLSSPGVAASLRWRPVDIAVGSALGVACGVIFWGFNFAYSALSPILGGILPGFASILHAFWYFSGPLALLIIRKPRAAIYVNFIGSLAEMLFGNSFSFSFVFISAALQGVFSELPFAVTRYRVFNPAIAVVSGALTAIEYGLYLLFFQYQGVALLSPRGVTHMVCEVLGGVLIAGLMSWALYRAIARTGALERFASGHDARRGVGNAEEA